jgi:hypothetical protein
LIRSDHTLLFSSAYWRICPFTAECVARRCDGLRDMTLRANQIAASVSVHATGRLESWLRSIRRRIATDVRSRTGRRVGRR